METDPTRRQVADPFHVVKLANSKLDECRRRVQNEIIGHRGRKADPLYRARRLLTKAHERVDDRGEAKLRGLLAAGDPHGEVRTAWHAKETVRSIYDIDDPAVRRPQVHPSDTRGLDRSELGVFLFTADHYDRGSGSVSLVSAAYVPREWRCLRGTRRRP